MTNPPSSMTRRRALACLATLPMAFSAGCTGFGRSTTPSDLRMLIPNTPGGGYDVTARTASRILEKHGLTGPIEKFNVIGGGGSVALARLVREAGNSALIGMVGVGVVGVAQVAEAPWGLSDATALARLVDEPEALVVRSGSPMPSLNGFLDAWRRGPQQVVVGVGSALGGPDHLFTVELARAADIDTEALNLVTFDGAGDLLAAVLDGTVDVGVAGAGEYIDQVDSGSLRILAVSKAPDARSRGVTAAYDAPTLTESGIPLEFTNWRGFVAPPGISDSARNGLVDALTRMRDTDEWQAAMPLRGWTDSFLTGDDFSEFIAAEDIRARTTLAEFGITR
ncbi:MULTISPECIES: Bug family tripartite tricarboxylate transporter substrate binding protein [unclassified Rhodococcus (in: high G+C Gram-positive bacteria)]|uniref:Bug family tripartite tricarboxylate transporter substrate binding protein n=1 Tax=unclassified Rhodococcus (in: high G+C Gram-positive bacteria) TaxID=192944 RepID=UPI00082F008F|nr:MULTISPECIES: tripartite tricarboxylate transporter substrate binding protein [unclassified Rhodococcus (in: high G+C Gram-positive bacteria)]